MHFHVYCVEPFFVESVYTGMAGQVLFEFQAQIKEPCTLCSPPFPATYLFFHLSCLNDVNGSRVIVLFIEHPPPTLSLSLSHTHHHHHKHTHITLGILSISRVCTVCVCFPCLVMVRAGALPSARGKGDGGEKERERERSH